MPAITATALTRKDIIHVLSRITPEEYSAPPCSLYERKILSNDLVGKNLEIHLPDHQTLCYCFDRKYLTWSEDNKESHEEYYELLKLPNRSVYLLHHLRTHVLPYEAMTLILEPERGQATVVYDRIGKASGTRDVNTKILYGTIGNAGDCHQKETEDLVCKTIDWKYGENAIIHTSYVNCECLAFTSPAPATMPGWKDYFNTFNPARYISLDQDLMLVSFYAPCASGMEVSMLMDLRDMTALCSAFGFDSTDHFCSNTFTAKGAYASFGFIGRFTIE